MSDTPHLDNADLALYRHRGHLTVNGVFRADEMDALVHDIERWGESFLHSLPPAQRVEDLNSLRLWFQDDVN